RLGSAELGGEIVFSANAFARHPWIEEIGPKAHLDRNVGPQRDRLFQPALADKAPRAADVGHHLDWQGCAHGGPPLRGPPEEAPPPPPATSGCAPRPPPQA